MLDPERLSQLKIIGEREQDDLPCCECNGVGPILIVGCDDPHQTFDVCYGCAVKLGLEW